MAVVTRDVVAREAWVRSLRGAGFFCTVHESVASARAVMRPADAGVLVLGDELLGELRDAGVVWPVLVALRAQTTSVEQVLEAGAAEWVFASAAPDAVLQRTRGLFRRAELERSLQRREREVDVVLELTQGVLARLDTRAVLDLFVQRVFALGSVQHASVVLARAGEQGLRMAASDDPTVIELGADAREQYPAIAAVLRSRQPLTVDASAALPPVRSGQRHRTRLLLPLCDDDEAFGVLCLRTTEAWQVHGRELASLQAVASALSIALRNAEQVSRLRESSVQAVEAQHEAEEQLATFRSFKTFFDNMADGTVVLDREGRLQHANPSAVEITGYSSEQLRGAQVLRWLRFVEPTNGAVADAYRAGTCPASVDVTLRRPDGVVRTLALSFSAALRDEGLTLVSFRDVTDALAMAQERMHAKRLAAVAALAGAAAHELNQPLQALMGYTELLGIKLARGDHSAAERSLEIMAGEVRRMAGIVRQLGSVTRFETKAYIGDDEILDLEKASASDGPAER